MDVGASVRRQAVGCRKCCGEGRKRRRRVLRRDEAERAGARDLARGSLRPARKRNAPPREPPEGRGGERVPNDVVGPREDRRGRQDEVEALPWPGDGPLLRGSTDVPAAIPLVIWRIGD